MWWLHENWGLHGKLLGYLSHGMVSSESKWGRNIRKTPIHKLPQIDEDSPKRYMLSKISGVPADKWQLWNKVFLDCPLTFSCRISRDKCLFRQFLGHFLLEEDPSISAFLWLCTYFAMKSDFYCDQTVVQQIKKWEMGMEIQGQDEWLIILALIQA